MHMEKQKLCIIIPVYKSFPMMEDIFSLKRLSQLAQGENIFWVAPDNLDLSAYKDYHWKEERFQNKYFKNVDGYTKLLLSQEFYQRFIDYDYMLICQTDALLLQPVRKIYEFIELSYDYYGAPWPEGTISYQYSFRGLSLVKWFMKQKVCYVGNGGFSLRNIERTIALLKEKKKYTRIWNSGEDQFFAYHGQCNQVGFRLAPLEVAEKFALEQNARTKMMNGFVPIGVHAWTKYYPELSEQYSEERML